MESSSAMLLSDYSGLTVDQMTALRKTLRENNTKLVIAKNTLMKKAAQSLGGNYAGLDTYWKGPTAVAFCMTDASASAKVLFNFGKENKVNEKPKLVAGFVDGVVYSKAQVDLLAQLPPRAELLATVVGSICAPMSSLVFTLNGILRELVGTIDSIADARAKA
jgi:large subunit ribosomal protein L10